MLYSFTVIFLTMMNICELHCIVSEAEFDVFGSSSLDLTPRTEAQYGSGDSQPTFSRFYRSLSSDTDTTDDLESGDLDVLDRSRSPVQRQPSIFYLEHSLTDDEDETSAAETTTYIRHADSGASKLTQSRSVEFRNLLKMMFGRDSSSCIQEDEQPTHHGSLGNFVVPKGSFGNAVLPHVSSFG